MDFSGVEVGDTVIRMLSGVVRMPLRVTEIDDQFIYCGPRDVGWKFARELGYEVDEELGWGVPDEHGVINTGSYLVSP